MTHIMSFVSFLNKYKFLYIILTKKRSYLWIKLLWIGKMKEEWIGNEKEEGHREGSIDT